MLPHSLFLRSWLTVMATGITLLFVFLLVVTGARASACYSIRDMDKRWVSPACS
jgi:hypothetical protein